MFHKRSLTCQLIKWHFVSLQSWFCKHSPHCPLCNLWRDCLSAHKNFTRSFPTSELQRPFKCVYCPIPLLPQAVLNTNNTHWETTDRLMAVQVTTLTQKTAILWHLVAQSYTTGLCGSSSKFGSFCTHLYIEQIELHTFLSFAHDSHQLHTPASLYVVTKIKVLSMLGTETKLSSPLF